MIISEMILAKVEKEKEFDEWLKTHQPFHWFAEFYEIIDGGGFML